MPDSVEAPTEGPADDPEDAHVKAPAHSKEAPEADYSGCYGEEQEDASRRFTH